MSITGSSLQVGEVIQKQMRRTTPSKSQLGLFHQDLYVNFVVVICRGINYKGESTLGP